MSAIFQTLVHQPILNLFAGLYYFIPDLGIVIILLTIIIKTLLYPLTKSQLKAQQSLSTLQPKMEELKKLHKDNKQLLAQETMKLYKENKVNPAGSCLPLLIQLPIFIALYLVLKDILKNAGFTQLYSFVPNPHTINPLSLGLLDLSKRSIVLAVLAGAAQFWQAKMMFNKRPPKEAGPGAKDEDMTSIMNKQMLYMMPAMTVFIGVSLPAGLSLYWLVSTLLTGAQMLYMKKHSVTKPLSPAVIEGKIVD